MSIWTGRLDKWEGFPRLGKAKEPFFRGVEAEQLKNRKGAPAAAPHATFKENS
jgi:hypothetical protein